MTTKEFAKILQDNLTSEYGVDLSVASHQQIYRALALICRQMMSENHKKFQSKAIGTGSKQVYYLCMEFLMGRSLKMSLFNLGLNDAAQKALAEADISLDSIYEEEPDSSLLGEKQARGQPLRPLGSISGRQPEARRSLGRCPRFQRAEQMRGTLLQARASFWTTVRSCPPAAFGRQ